MKYMLLIYLDEAIGIANPDSDGIARALSKFVLSLRFRACRLIIDSTLGCLKPFA
jgi:hypothetical protein